MSLRAKPCEKNPATNSETSPSRCSPRFRSSPLGASSASDISTTSGLSFMPCACVVKRLRSREQGEQIDDVVLGLVFHGNVLMCERVVERIPEELPHVR